MSIIICIISMFITVDAVEDIDKIIVIDPGHGGMDIGASVGNIYESDLVLQISKKIKEVFENSGYFVILTRENEEALSGDKFIKKIDMQRRVNIINQSSAKVAISIHLNKYSSSKFRGAQVFYDNTILENKILANAIQKNMKNYLGNTNRKISMKDNLYLLNRINIPCCLIECGFMSNHEEFKLLQTASYQYKLSKSILLGINEFLNY